MILWNDSVKVFGTVEIPEYSTQSHTLCECMFLPTILHLIKFRVNLRTLINRTFVI